MASLPSPVVPHVDPAGLSLPSAYRAQLHADSHHRSNPFRGQQLQQQQQQPLQPQRLSDDPRPSPSPTASTSDAALDSSSRPMPPPPASTAPTAMSHYTTTAPSFSSASTFSQTFSPPAGPVFPASPDSALRSTSPRHSPSHHRAIPPHDQYWQAQAQHQQQQQQQQHGQQAYTPSPLYRYELADDVNDHYAPQQHYYYPAQFYQHSTSPSPMTPPAAQMTAQERRRAKEILKARRHVCPMCDKRFNRPSSLATHMSVHTGAKPYQCNREGCGRRFSVSSNLRRHERTHDMRGSRNSKTSDMSSPRTPARQPAPQLQLQQAPQTPHPASPATTTTAGMFTPQYQYVYQPAYQQQVEYGMWHGAGGLRQYAITRRDSVAPSSAIVQPTTPPTPPQPILMPQPTKSNSLMLS